VKPAPLGKVTDQVNFRDWRPSDSISEITELLHASYGFLARMGFNYTASFQDDATTLRRLRDGFSLMAEQQGRIIGTITLYSPTTETKCEWYARAHHFGQFGVHPDFQKRGVGRELLRLIELRARAHAVTELALDTSEGAEHLCQWYDSLGYRFIQHVSWPQKTYRSVVLSKTLGP
jgi:GNAT superfamily N-acetyltransferase